MAFLRAAFLLVATAALASALTAPALNYGPAIDVGCTGFDIGMPNPNMYPNVADRYYYVYTNGDLSHGYSSGEIYTNSPSNFMNMADGKGYVYYKIDSGRWTPLTGKLSVNISLYSSPARTAATWIGSGNMTSTDYFPVNYTDNLAPKKWVVAVGGNVTMTYQIIPSAVKAVAAGFTTTVFTSRTVNLYFPPNRNMWSDKETFTNRYFVRDDVTGRFFAPLFDSIGTEPFWNSAVKYTPYTADYDAVIQMWGSNGFSFTTNSYSSPNVGIDVGFALTCNPSPDDVIHLTPVLCPLVVNCASCTQTPVTVSGKCNAPVKVDTSATCLTLTVDDNAPCTSTVVHN